MSSDHDHRASSATQPTATHGTRAAGKRTRTQALPPTKRRATATAATADGETPKPLPPTDDGWSREVLDDACSVGERAIGADECATDAIRSPEAITGIKLFLTSADEVRGLADRTVDYRSVGPGQAGPYRLQPHTKDERLVYYVAYHVTRRQEEWLVGPESIQAFASSAEMYAGAAAQLLPGSAKVPGSQADGADSVRDPDSMLRREATPPPDNAADLLHGGGSSLIFARNARLRLTEYVKPARLLAERLAADVAAGRVDHLDARAQAVDGRNHLLEETRQRQSPSARYSSRAVKEEGKSLADMTAKKVRDNLGAYNVSAETRQLLDADSALWAKYAAALDAGEDVMKAALRDLGQSPAVSRSIIASAGKTNARFTRLARWGAPVGAALGVLGAADMIVDIKDAIEADNWHAAAGELAGFAGGVVGGELGGMGTVWIASALVSGPGAGLVIVASLVGGAIGGGLGARAAKGLVDILADGSVTPGLATPLAPAGGFAGLHGKDGPRSAAWQIEDAIFTADGELSKLSTSIPRATSRRDLAALQRKRLEVLARRQQMEDLLMALRLGAFDGPQESRLDAPARSAPQPARAPSDCDIDHDCDDEVGW